MFCKRSFFITAGAMSGDVLDVITRANVVKIG